jgi:hypothetical protein
MTSVLTGEARHGNSGIWGILLEVWRKRGFKRESPAKRLDCKQARQEAKLRNIENRLRRVLGPNFDAQTRTQIFPRPKNCTGGVHMPQ